jgi:hypothetical protein
MLTPHQLTRIQRQMHRRIRMTLVQRRVDAHLAAAPNTAASKPERETTPDEQEAG